MTRSRLAELAVKMKAPAEPATPAESAAKAGVLMAPAKHGEKGDYKKFTVTLPPNVYLLIMDEVIRRKLAGEPEPGISAVIREAVVKHFSK